MNPEDNIKNFFQKRLMDDNLKAEQWNTPSEDIWEKSKVHFPKDDKNKKQFFLFFIGFIGLLMLVYIGYTQMTNYTDSRLTENKIISTDQELTTIDNDKSSLSPDKETLKTGKTSLASNTNQEVIDNNEQGIRELTNVPSPSATESQSNTLATTGAQNDTHSSFNSKALVNKTHLTSPPSQQTTSSRSSKHKLTSITKAKSNWSSSTSSTKPSLINSDQSSTSSSASTSKGSLAEIVKANKEEKLDDINVNELPMVPIDLLSYEMSRDLDTEFIITPLKTNKKWEIGISASPLVIPIHKFIESDSVGADVADITLKYNSLNLPVTRLLNEKWSVTSGLYYKGGHFGANISAEEMLDIGDISLSLDDNFADVSITLENEEQEILVELKPDEEIRDGDIIRGDGSGKLKFDVFQIPFMANYHIRKNRFEYLFTFGPSLDLAKVTISDFDIALSKNNRVITEPISFSPMSHYYLEYGIQAGVGTKFHLNETTNISYGLKTDLTAIFLATHEIGLHYRF